MSRVSSTFGIFYVLCIQRTVLFNVSCAIRLRTLNTLNTQDRTLEHKGHGYKVSNKNIYTCTYIIILCTRVQLYACI